MKDYAEFLTHITRNPKLTDLSPPRPSLEDEAALQARMAQETVVGGYTYAPNHLGPWYLQGRKIRDIREIPERIEALRAMLRYDPETGWLHYNFELRPIDGVRQDLASRQVGIGTPRRITVWAVNTAAANIVWLWHRGTMPSGRLRRHDGDNQNDRIENLYDPRAEMQLTTRQSVAQTKRPRKSKGLGVCASGPDHWQAYIRVDGIQKNLGRFRTRAEALAARAAWDIKALGLGDLV